MLTGKRNVKFTPKDVQTLIRLNQDHHFFTRQTDGKPRWARLLNQDVKILSQNLGTPITSKEDLLELRKALIKYGAK